MDQKELDERLNKTIICPQCKAINRNERYCHGCNLDLLEVVNGTYIPPKQEKQEDKETLKNKNIFKEKLFIINIVISIIICIVGIVFIYLSNDKSQIYVKESAGAQTTGLGYSVTYGADFYTEMSENTKYIASATRETYYLIERCFGILLIIIGIFYLLHNLKRKARL